MVCLQFAGTDLGVLGVEACFWFYPDLKFVLREQETSQEQAGPGPGRLHRANMQV